MAAAPPYSRSSGWATTASARSQSSGRGSSCSITSTPGLFHQAPADDLEAQGLVGALEDRQDPSVDEVAADRILLGVAVAAVDLHRLAGHPLGRLAHVRLDHGGLHRALALGH